MGPVKGNGRMKDTAPEKPGPYPLRDDPPLHYVTLGCELPGGGNQIEPEAAQCNVACCLLKDPEHAAS